VSEILKLSETPIGKVWASVSKYGLSGGLQDAAARWARNRLNVPYDTARDYGWILGENNPARLPTPETGPLKINWLLPGLGRGSGGLLNIFRAIHNLEKWGHENRVYVLGNDAPSGAEAQELVREFYFPIKAPIEALTGEVADSDALVGTGWTTAYAARTIANTARKFYFVQDLEDRFFPQGSLCEFAKETYRWGFHGITLGRWIADVLHSEFGMACSPFGFSYDREVYSPSGRVHIREQRKRVLFYSRPHTERRGFELGLLALSLIAKRMPEVEFVLVGFRQRKMRVPFRVVFAGVLSPAELAGLYCSCDVALVLSHTNLSMLPLELMACGCAVVSNRAPNVEWLLTEETTQLANPTPQSLAEAVLTLLDKEELHARKVAAGLAFAQATDWILEIKKIEDALYKGLGLSHDWRSMPDGVPLSAGAGQGSLR
jgi:glycosyltransferase involved in cell wall biosynthesis